MAAVNLPGSRTPAYAPARGAIAPLDYRTAATATPAPPPPPPVVRTSPASVVAIDPPPPGPYHCVPCETDRPTPQNLRDNPERLAKVKTEMCHFFEEGGSEACPFGSNCNYAHGKDELKFRYPTLRLMESSGQIVNANTYLARPCMTWVSTGACPFGRRCTFIHDPYVSGPEDCPSWLPAATANTNALVIIDRHAGHREASIHQENFLVPQSIWENCRPSKSGEFGRRVASSSPPASDAEWDWFDTYALVTNERVPIFAGVSRHDVHAPYEKLSRLKKLCIVRHMRSEDERSNPSSQYHRDYVFAPTHSLHSELCMILQERYFELPEVDFTYADGISHEIVAREISLAEYVARTRCHMTGMSPYDSHKFVTAHEMSPCNSHKFVIAHEVAFAPKGEHFANVSIWFDASPVRLEPSQIKRSRRLKQKNKAQIRNEHTRPNANGALISRTSSADFPPNPNNPPPAIDPFVPMLPDDDDDSSRKLIMAIIDHRIDSLILEGCSYVRQEQINKLCAREAQLAEAFGGRMMFHDNWMWPKREGMGCVTMFTKAPPGNTMPYIPVKDAQKSPCVHNWNTFVKTIGALDNENENPPVPDNTKRLSVFRSIDGSIPKTSISGSGGIPHILSGSSSEAWSTKDDETWREIFLGLPENGQWETALRLHASKRSGSFDHSTTRNTPLSTVPFVQA